MAKGHHRQTQHYGYVHAPLLRPWSVQLLLDAVRIRSIQGKNIASSSAATLSHSAQFKEIGRRLGPFDVDIVKVGAYGPGQAWIDIHMPSEASSQVHLDLGGKRMLPVHWGSFNVALHAWDEPIERTLSTASTKGVEVITPKPGESVSTARPYTNVTWWRKLR